VTNPAPDLTIGIEEEYLLVHQDTLELAEAPAALMAACQAAFEGQVSPEFLQCQIEVGTRVCNNITQAREDLGRLRRCIADEADKFGLAPIAASCHPFSDWRKQHHTDKERYNQLATQLAGVARRMLICGMHVHVGITDDNLRADLMPQLSYFLPHLLAMSCSSPFWRGEDTGLASYRLSIFDNLPRTGLPPAFNSFDAYQRTTGVLVDLGVIEDTSKIWWDLRPSHNYPTLEVRICDVMPRMEDTLTVAAVYQCLTRFLWRLRTQNQRWRNYDRFLISENRWRAQRYGMSEGLIDFGRQEVVSFAALMEELILMLAEDAAALDCEAELRGVRRIVGTGTSADRQRAAHRQSLEDGQSGEAAMRAVVSGLIAEYREGLTG
jgi:carboxylate-amine ligase